MQHALAVVFWAGIQAVTPCGWLETAYSKAPGSENFSSFTQAS